MCTNSIRGIYQLFLFNFVFGQLVGELLQNPRTTPGGHSLCALAPNSHISMVALAVSVDLDPKKTLT